MLQVGTIAAGGGDFSLCLATVGAREEVIDYSMPYQDEPLTFSMSPPLPLPQVHIAFGRIAILEVYGLLL